MRVAIEPPRPLTSKTPRGLTADDLIERLLEVERAYTAFNAQRALRPDEARLEWRQLGQRTLAVRDPVRPEIAYYNRVLGLGVDALDCLDDIVAWHDEIGAPTQLDLTPDAMTGSVLDAIQDRGFRHAGLMTVLVGRPDEIVARFETASPGEPAITLERVTDDNVDAFFDHLESTAPSLPPIRPELRALRRQHFVAPHFHVTLASIEAQAGDDPSAGRHVASASLFVHQGVAVLANATTLPRARGRGCQHALLRHRLRRAAELGCDLVVTDVLWGTPSYGHVQRIGLQPVWDVAWWVRDETC